jgi:hypothetical protein
MPISCDTGRGEWMYKYSFSDSRRVQRFFRLMLHERCLSWGSSPTDDKCLRVDLNEAVGVIYGPQTTTFARLMDTEGAPESFRCFSVLFVGRTLDLCCFDDTADVWFLSVQAIIADNANSPAKLLSRREVLFRKAWLKITLSAQVGGVSVSELFRKTISSCLETTKPICSFSPQIDVLRDSLQKLRKEVVAKKREWLDVVSDQLRTVFGSVLNTRNLTSRHDDLVERLRENLKVSETERVRLHNELVDLRGNIRVFTRIRPLLSGEVDDVSLTDGLPTVCISHETNDSVSVYIPRDVRRRTYTFDRVFQPSKDQTELFNELAPFIQSAIDGFNVCVFSYGVTNSGKTYSMEGTKSIPGINRLAIEKIFEKRETVSISVIQIYNETVTDLLNSGRQLDIRMSDAMLPGLKEEIVEDPNSAQSLMLKAATLRATNSTRINQVSSRSHLVVTLKLSSGGKLHLIDLAGSENVNRSGAMGDTLREAQNINKSLSALGDVVHALIDLKKNGANSGHVPYRNSKLTMLLRDSLSGNSKTVMILQVSPAQSDVGETLNSLSFGQRVRTVQMGKAARNKHISPRE